MSRTGGRSRPPRASPAPAGPRPARTRPSCRFVLALAHQLDLAERAAQIALVIIVAEAVVLVEAAILVIGAHPAAAGAARHEGAGAAGFDLVRLAADPLQPRFLEQVLEAALED